jgi:hypothetical protein
VCAIVILYDMMCAIVILYDMMCAIVILYDMVIFRCDSEAVHR